MLALTPLWPPPRLDHARRVHAQLVAVHVGERGAATSRLEEQTADLDAKISVRAQNVGDPILKTSQVDGGSSRPALTKITGVASSRELAQHMRLT